MAQTNGKDQILLQRFRPGRAARTDTSVQQLLQASRDGREDDVRTWLDVCPDRRKRKLLNTKDKYGFAAVHYAARFNRFKIMQLLLLDDADPEILTDDGLTPLHYAARYLPLIEGDTQPDEATSPVDTVNPNFTITLSSTSQQMMMLLVNHYFVDVTIADTFGLTPLHYACARGNRAAVEVLLASGKVVVNIRDKQQNTPLHGACRVGDPWIVERMLDAGAGVLLVNEEGVNPLHVACQEGWSDVVNKIMLKCQGDRDRLVTSVDHEANTPLHLACESGEAEIVRVLLLQEADPTITKLHDVSPLHIAAKEGFVDIVGMLLEYSEIKIDTRDEDFETPLHYAVKLNQEEMIKFLLEKKANIEAQNNDSYTPLLTAVAQGKKQSMEVLMDKGAAVEVFDREGKSIVYLAAQYNHVNILKSLILGPYKAIGHKLRQTSDNGNNTPLHIAAKKGHVEAVKVLLLARKIKADARNAFGKTPMHLAAQKGHTKVLKELIRHKRIMIYDEDDDSNTPLHIACIHGHYVVAQLLLETGSNPDARNAISWTPLDCAAQGGWTRVIQLLIDAEADLEPMDIDHVTPLQLACQEGHLKVVELLMSQGAKVSHTNGNGLNCLDIAIENGHKDVVLAIIMSNQWKSALRNTTRLPNGKDTTPTRRLIKKMPGLAEVMFTRCVTTNEIEGVSKDDQHFEVTFDYEFLEDDRDPIRIGLSRTLTSAFTFSRNGRVKGSDREAAAGSTDTLDVDDTQYEKRRAGKGGFTNNWGPYGFVKKYHPLSLLVESKQTDLLTHPLVTSLLNYKWVHYGQYLYLANICLYLLFLAFITTFAVFAPAPNSRICAAARNFNSSMMNDSVDVVDVCRTEGFDVHKERFLYISAACTGIFALIKLAFEFFQLLKLRHRYLLDWINYLEIILFVCSILFIFVFFNDCLCPTFWQWQIGAFAVFLAWIALVIIVRKLPLIGIYVVMFMDIFYTFWKMALLALLLILSFSFSFYMLFNDPTIQLGRFPFMDLGLSIIKTMTMTTGEFEFDTTFRQCGPECLDELQYAPVSIILWILFLILMPILLTNLLVGLAVDDIKGIQQAAVLKRLALRVELTLSLEELLPRSWRRSLVIGRRLVRPNRKLNPGENLYYNILKAERFDSIENITNTLNPPLEPVEEVQQQNSKLALKVEELQEVIENMSGTQERLVSLMRALTAHSGIEVDEDEGTFMKIRSNSRPLSPVPRPLSPVPRPHSPVPRPVSPSRRSRDYRSRSPSPELGHDRPDSRSRSESIAISEIAQL